jgi:CSLREA domain-containing protein
MTARSTFRSVAAFVVAVAAFVVAVAAVLPLVGQAPVALAGTGETFRVNTTVDGFDGVCDQADCSLRDAVAAAGPDDRVLVPSGFYTLTRTGTGGIGQGDIDLRAAITIVGVGQTGVFIDASGLGERAFTMGTSTIANDYGLRDLTIFGARDRAIDGAAVSVEGGVGHLRGVTIAGSRGRNGGAVWSAPGTQVRAVRSLFLGNTAAGSGGAIHSQGKLSLSGTTVAGNRATDGGGIDVTGGPVVLVNSTVAENFASKAGGGIVIEGAASLVFVTVAHNEAERGGGLRRPADASGDVSVRGSILSDNLAARHADCAATLVSAGGNAGWARGCDLHAPSDRTGVDPLLRRLGPNGGPTPSLAIRPESPAVGAAGACDEPADQRGAPRDRRCDSGAYELVRCLGKVVDIVGTSGADELSGGRGRDVLLGLGGPDEFQGSIGKDRACGGPGDDLLIAGPGEDVFDGEAGNDRVKGEAGGDWLWGGAGRDRLAGGPGEDTCESDGADREPRGCEIFATVTSRRVS